jgi:hypothetical protein
MKKRLLFLAGGCLVCALVSGRSLGAEESYHLFFSTYVGGTSWEHARDVFADTQGNVYVCGSTASRDFPTTPGAYSQTFHTGDTSGDQCDAFVCKFGPDGQLIWSTYRGGPGYDRAYGIEVDAQGYVYTTQDMGTGTPQDDTDYPFTAGARGALGPATFLNGMVDELRLYSRPLTAREIRDLYDAVPSQR